MRDPARKVDLPPPLRPLPGMTPHLVRILETSDWLPSRRRCYKLGTANS
jgi:hypothetical protein